MKSDYEIFECLPSGYVNWRDSAPDLTSARLLLNQFAKDSENDFFGFCLATREVAFRVDGGAGHPLLAKRVFQIAYTEKSMRERADLLRSLGFGVLSLTPGAAFFIRRLGLKARAVSIFWTKRAPVLQRSHASRSSTLTLYNTDSQISTRERQRSGRIPEAYHRFFA